MHILIIPSEEYVPKHAPAAGIFQHDQALALKNEGIKVGAISASNRYSFFTLLKSSIGIKTSNKWLKGLSRIQTLKILFQAVSGKFPLISRRRKEGIEVIDAIGIFWFKSSSRKAQINKWVFTAERAFQFYVKENGFPDVIHAHNALNAGIFANYIKETYGISYVLTEHSTELAEWKIPENIFNEIKGSYVEASAIISVSLPFKKQLDNQFFQGEDSFLFIPNVLNGAFERDIVFNKSDKMRLTHIANLIDIKDQTTLIKAFGILSLKITDLELIIIGDGVDKEKLIQLTNELGISDKVFFKGFLNRKSIIDVLSTSDLFVLSSKYETFGVVVIEALACGVPCVASICGGPESIINSSNGKLFEVGDYIQLAEKIEEALATTYDRDKIRTDCLKLYGSKAFANKMINLYSEIKN